MRRFTPSTAWLQESKQEKPCDRVSGRDIRYMPVSNSCPSLTHSRLPYPTATRLHLQKKSSLLLVFDRCRDCLSAQKRHVRSPAKGDYVARRHSQPYRQRKQYAVSWTPEAEHRPRVLSKVVVILGAPCELRVVSNCAGYTYTHAHTCTHTHHP